MTVMHVLFQGRSGPSGVVKVPPLRAAPSHSRDPAHVLQSVRELHAGRNQVINAGASPILLAMSRCVVRLLVIILR